MRESDPFWQLPTGYRRQFAITREKGRTLEQGENKAWVKEWYRRQSKHWGRAQERMFKSWIQAHKPECLVFCKTFLKLLNGRYKTGIPKSVVDRIVAQFEDVKGGR